MRLAPVWYCGQHGLNRYANAGDIELINIKINRGVNCYQHRLDWYAATAPVMLADVKTFEKP